jgi:hypothetical protein
MALQQKGLSAGLCLRPASLRGIRLRDVLHVRHREGAAHKMGLMYLCRLADQDGRQERAAGRMFDAGSSGFDIVAVVVVQLAV